MTSTPTSSEGGTEMTAKALTDPRELAHRTSDGIEITLFWSKLSNRVTVAVIDTHSDEALEFEVHASAALDAFNHPYASAASQRVRSLAPRSDAVPH
jgi:hypothetical protein